MVEINDLIGLGKVAESAVKFGELLNKRYPNLKPMNTLLEMLKDDPSLKKITNGEFLIEQDPEIRMMLMKDPVLASMYSDKERKLKNTLGIIDQALRIEPIFNPSNEQIDDDWATQFFNYSEDVSSEKMQLLWGKVLAGEINQPGTFSLRTLDFIKKLSAKEAEYIQERLQYVLDIATPIESNKSYHYLYHERLSKYLAFGDFIYLSELGIISAVVGNLVGSSEKISLEHGSFYLQITSKPLIKVGHFYEPNWRPTNVFKTYTLSTIGRELLKLNEPIKGDIEYLRLMGEIMVSENNYHRDYEYANMQIVQLIHIDYSTDPIAIDFGIIENIYEYSQEKRDEN